MTIINLRERFGDTYRIAYDEAYQHERSEFRAIEEPHLQIIPCEHGHVYPSSGDTLAVFSAGTITVGKLRRLPCCKLWTDGDDGATFLFHVDHFNVVAEVVKPRRRRHCHLSPEQRQQNAERLQAYQFKPKDTQAQSV